MHFEMFVKDHEDILQEQLDFMQVVTFCMPFYLLIFHNYIFLNEFFSGIPSECQTV